jgi:hypothetical protein
MTVAELMKALEQYPPDAEVCLSAPHLSGAEDTPAVAEVELINVDDEGADISSFVVLKDENADARMDASCNQTSRPQSQYSEARYKKVGEEKSPV